MCSKLTTPILENNIRLPRQFFFQDTVTVARKLLGKRLIRLERNQPIGGIITETEAYRGEEDLACHARAGKTNRTRVMYGPPGYAYIYFNYGIHWLLNIVTEEKDFPAAVLIRAIKPTEGLEIIANRRKGIPRSQWTNGPAKICQALNLDNNFNGTDICAPESVLFVEEGQKIQENAIAIKSRVGIQSVPEPWKSIPWRFQLK